VRTVDLRRWKKFDVHVASVRRPDGFAQETFHFFAAAPMKEQKRQVMLSPLAEQPNRCAAKFQVLWSARSCAQAATGPFFLKKGHVPFYLKCEQAAT